MNRKSWITLFLVAIVIIVLSNTHVGKEFIAGFMGWPRPLAK